MDSETRKEINRLSKLRTMKEKSEEYIKHEAQKNVTVREMVRTGNFIGDAERKFAKALFDKYLDNYDFENVVDLNTLGILVFNEVLIQRVQKTINAQQDSKGNFYLNDKMVKSLHDTQNHVLDLKKQLGLDKEKTENELTAWQQANKKLDLHIAFNRNEYSTVCSNCGELLLLRRKTKDFETIKHPFFLGRYWINPRAVALVENGSLSKEDYAFIFYTSADWVNYILEHKGKLIEIDDFTQEEIKNFMQSKDYLKDFVKSKKTNDILNIEKR